MISKERLPSHVAIIMDGNGRWATRQNKARTEGHRAGLETAKKIVEFASETGIQYLSLYTFSTENWKRAQSEVSFLMSLIKNHLRKELDFYRAHQIRVVHTGDRRALPADILAEIDSVVQDTSAFKGMIVNLAINHGGRDEIVRAANRAIAQGARTLTEETVRSNLDAPMIPDPDLVVRTGGELRLSNFLLWQTAYAELYFSEKLWPDFQTDDFALALEDFARRERRFGGVK